MNNNRDYLQTYQAKLFIDENEALLSVKLMEWKSVNEDDVLCNQICVYN